MTIMVNGLGGSKYGNRKAVVSRTVTATDSAITITLATNAGYMAIQNLGVAICYIGGTGVTTASDGHSMVFNPRQIVEFGFVQSGFTVGVITSSATLSSIIGVNEDA